MPHTFTELIEELIVPKRPRRAEVKPHIELAERVLRHFDDYRYLANDINDLKDLADKILATEKAET